MTLFPSLRRRNILTINCETMKEYFFNKQFYYYFLKSLPQLCFKKNPPLLYFTICHKNATKMPQKCHKNSYSN